MRATTGASGGSETNPFGSRHGSVSLAHVSSSPGRTQTINFFAVCWKPRRYTADVMLVDLPGYGYARVSKRVTAEWPKFIDPYLQKRPNLALCVVLVDVNVPPQASDMHLLDFLRQAGREFIVVGTKSDRLSNNRLRQGLKELQQGLEVEEIFPFSATTGSGLSLLLIARSADLFTVSVSDIAPPEPLFPWSFVVICTVAGPL